MYIYSLSLAPPISSSSFPPSPPPPPPTIPPMAMSDATSTPQDWAQFYHRNNISVTDQTSPNMFGTAVADSTIVTTASFSSQTASPPKATGPIANIEGRVGKSPRRRSRASRKAPTTLLNTDTTNFRAMVQQFTGIPSAPPYSNSSAIIQTSTTSGPPFINFSLGINDAINFTSHVHQPPQQYFNNNNNNNNNHPRPQHQQQHHQQGTMFMLDDNITSNNSEGFFLDGLPAGQSTAPPRPTSSTGFLF